MSSHKVVVSFDSNLLRRDLITRRVIEENKTFRDVCKEIGVSIGTYSRLESGKLCDMETFCKVVNWLGENPGKYFVVQKASPEVVSLEQLKDFIQYTK